MQTSQPNDLSTLSNLDEAASGMAFFDNTSTNKPNGVTGGGIVHTQRQGDIGWQMLVANDMPREFWQRTRKLTAPYWRNWKKFTDAHSVNLAIETAMAATSEADTEKLKTMLDEHGAAEASERDAAIASAISSAVSDIPQGLDRAAVESVVDGRLDDELDDERAARNDAITAAVNAATSAIITGRQGAIDAALATERAAIDRAVDSKTGTIDTKVTALDAKLHSERNDRMAADTAEARKRETATTAETEARENAIRTLDTKVAGDIAAAERRSDAKLINAIEGEKAQRSTEIQTKVSEAHTAISGAITSAMAAERNARKAADKAVAAHIANSGFPSGTKMLFRQSTAPTGWTKDTTHNNKALRVISGSVGSGGNVSFTGALSHYKIYGSISNRLSGSVAGHRLTLAQIPSHHQDLLVPSGHTGRGAGGYSGATDTYYTDTKRVTPTGGNHPHAHGVGTLSVASTFRGSSIDMRVRYVDVIIATKD